MKTSKILKKILFALLPCVILLGLTEAGLRLAGFNFVPRQKELYLPTVAAFYGTFQPYWPVLLDLPGYMWVRNSHVAGRNPDGTFAYIWPIEKNQGKVRVAFVGGSTVESQPGSMYESFPELCIELLNEVAGTDRYEVVNVGCSSYSSHQSLIAVQRYVLPTHPDVVVLYDGWNDFGIRDGYSDREKDFLIRMFAEASEAGAFTKWLRRLCLSRLVGLVVQKTDVTWPRPRCNVSEFRNNLRKSAGLVAAAGATPLVVLKPIANKLPINNWTGVPEMLQVFGPAFGMDAGAIYRGIHGYAVEAQRYVVSNVPAARLVDVEARLNKAQSDFENAPEGVSVFINDAMHCSALGNYFVAEEVAAAIAPELAERIRAYADSSANWKRMAIKLYSIQSPFEAAYAAERAMQTDPSLASELTPLLEQAKSEFEFRRLFDRGHWDNGQDVSWEERMDALGKCLRMRPSDIGLILQILRVSMYMGHAGEAAELMADFQPASERDYIDWLWMCCQSHIEGNRLAQAEWLATEILSVAPDHPDAINFMSHIESQRQF